MQRGDFLQCGLLGRTLGHSFSPQIHALLGNYSYQLFEKELENLADFLQNGAFDALNVTIPYKKAVLPCCAELSDAVRAVGCANTLVRRKDGTLAAYNTDVFGFTYLLQSSGVDVCGKKALVFGSGGASLSVCHVLRQKGAREIVVISRSGKNNYVNLYKHSDAEILINTTPLGMYPENGESPADISMFPKCIGVLDVIYNPLRTAFVQQAEQLGIQNAGGMIMLIAQAVRSAELFTGKPAENGKIEQITDLLRQKMQNITLIGMPGCGKTTVGRLLAKRLHRPFFDADEELEKQLGIGIPQVFARYGEAYFRDRESEILSLLGKKTGAVIAAGGGAVLREENYLHLHQNGTIVRLSRALSSLSSEGRPVLFHKDVQTLYAERMPYYERFADVTVRNDGTPEQTVTAILEAMP